MQEWSWYRTARCRATFRIFPALAAFVVIFCLSILSQATAQVQNTCEGSTDYSRCLWSARGEPNIESYEVENSKAIRIVGFVALRYEKSVMVEFRHDRYGRSWLSMFDPLGPGRLVVPIENSDWSNALSQWKKFSATQAEFKRQKVIDEKKQQEEENKTGVRTVMVCADGSDVEIDTALDGAVAHLSASDCFNDEADSYLDDVRTLAYSLIPYCANLIEKVSSFCLALDGDKFAAAEAMNLATSVKLADCDKNEPSASLLPLLSPDAVLRVNGNADVKGAAAVARAWESFACQAKMHGAPPQIVEARGQYVRIVGSLGIERSEKLPQSNLSSPKFFDAITVEQWKRNDAGKFELISWEIGAFVQEKDQ